MLKIVLQLLLYIYFLFLPLNSLANGESTYKSICMACHANGVNGSPRFQNNRDWAPIIREGKVHVIAEAYNGIRKMPAQGGRPDLKLEDFSEALIYMINNSGGKWESPTEKEYIQIRKKVQQLKK